MLWLLAALAAAVMALGIYGYARYFGGQGRAFTWLDCLYATLQLFMFQSSFEPGRMNWALEAARFAAPAVSAYAVVLSVMSVLGGRLRLAGIGGHVVICGLGRKGSQLAREFLQQGRKVVVIERDEANDNVAACRQLGAAVLFGDARDAVLLRTARAACAQSVFACCGEDASNMDIALALFSSAGLNLRRGGRHRTPLEQAPAAGEKAAPVGQGPRPLPRCFVHLADLPWLPVGGQRGDPWQPTTWSFYDNCARSMLAEHPLDRQTAGQATRASQRSGTAPKGSSTAPKGSSIGPDDPRAVHLVVIGFDRLAEALVVQALRTAHLANLRHPRVTVIDPQARLHEARFLAKYPQAPKVGDLAFCQAEGDDPAVRRDLSALAGDVQSLVTLAICGESDTASLALAMRLPADVARAGIPVWVKLSGETGLAEILEQAQARPAGQAAGLHAFGTVAQGCLAGLFSDERLDVLPRAIHDTYCQKAAGEGRRADQDPALLPWEQLDEGFRDSNRQQADHIPVKLRTIGCEIAPLDRCHPPAEINDEQVELLARMEHARWCAERFLAGWQPGPKDKPRKISPYLVAWEQLPPGIQDYDRSAVRSIPAILARIGKGIRQE